MSLWTRLALLSVLALPSWSYASELDGVWLFLEEINRTASGEVVEIPGPAYQGILIYTSDGYVSVNLLPRGRAWRAGEATLEELRQTVGQGSSTGYAGRYEVDAKAKTVTHIPLASLDPADEGHRLVRSYVVEGNALRLSGKWSYQGRDLVFEVHWTRADPRSDAAK